jgi:hypothetical protein
MGLIECRNLEQNAGSAEKQIEKFIFDRHFTFAGPW